MQTGMKRFLRGAAILCAATMGACSDNVENYDAYANWEERNAAYYLVVADSARNAIAAAKHQYGDDWEAHCDWRMFQSLTKSPEMQGSITDSICVHIFDRGTGDGCPAWSDTVRVHYRGYLMAANYLVNGELKEQRKVFSQSYIGDFDEERIVPALMGVSSTVPGFSTALQYMHEGDNWLVYIPQELGYGSQTQTTIPAYSTLIFQVKLVKCYKPGEEIPTWKGLR